MVCSLDRNWSEQRQPFQSYLTDLIGDVSRTLLKRTIFFSFALGAPRGLKYVVVVVVVVVANTISMPLNQHDTGMFS